MNELPSDEPGKWAEAGGRLGGGNPGRPSCEGNMTDTPPQWALEAAASLRGHYQRDLTWGEFGMRIALALAEARAAGYRAGQEAMRERATRMAGIIADEDVPAEAATWKNAAATAESAIAALPIEDEKTPMTDLSDLIARLEAAGNEDDFDSLRDLDREVALATGWTEDRKRLPGAPWQDQNGAYFLVQPFFTMSLDAALRLVPDKHWFSIAQFGPPVGGENTAFMAECITLTDNGIKKHWGSKNNSPALALCIAALRARSAP